MLAISPPPAPLEVEEVGTPVSPEEQVGPEIPASKFAHIRTLVKYGMTVSQVAEVYGVAARIAGIREGHLSISGPPRATLYGAPPSIPTLGKQRSRLSRDCVTATGGMSSRSIRSRRRRAARERLSSSTLGTFLLHRLVLIMVPSTARQPPVKAGDGATNSSSIPEDV